MPIALLLLTYGIVGGMEMGSIPLGRGGTWAFLALAGAAAVTYMGNGGEKR